MEGKEDGDNDDNWGENESHRWDLGKGTVDGDEVWSSDLLLFWDRFSFPFLSPLMMKSVTRLTSDNFTGFNRNSSAPSSKHLTNNSVKDC